jgi:3-isopropylmalate/(R)-2-methylmalate dehydratase small subunit
MEKFIRHEGVAAPLLHGNVDTDAIIPSREMKRVSKAGLGDGLFAGWRYLTHGGRDRNPNFVLNQAGYEGASILLSGNNFGCGSSREHAVWALKEFGFRAIIAPGYGAIFASNCLNNGLLPLQLEQQQITEIARWVGIEPAHNRVLIDLPAQRVEAGGWVYEFEIEPGAKRMLVEGLDAIAVTQARWQEIQAFHQQRQALRPWLY